MLDLIPMHPSAVKFIVIHHSGATHMQSPVEITRYHTHTKQWGDCGYHKMIDYRGKVTQGREDCYKGVHCPGLNSSSLAVCCIGDFSKMPLFIAQRNSLIQVLAMLLKRYNLNEKALLLHGEFLRGQTSCPGKQLQLEFPEIIRLVKKYIK